MVVGVKRMGIVSGHPKTKLSAQKSFICTRGTKGREYETQEIEDGGARERGRGICPEEKKKNASGLRGDRYGP